MKYEIIDKREYTTTVWIVETKDDIYTVTCQENEVDWDWHISSEEKDYIDRYSDLAKELINMCTGDISSPSDY